MNPYQKTSVLIKKGGSYEAQRDSILLLSLCLYHTYTYKLELKSFSHSPKGRAIIRI